jgi:hypothetical protein
LLAMTAGGWFGILLTGGGLVAALAVVGGVHHFFWYLLAAPVVLFSVWTVTFALDRRDPADDHAFLIGQITRMTDAHPT